MLERGISEVDVRDVLENGEMIETYPEELPFPGYLVLGRCSGRAVHVVACDDVETASTIIITVYEPDPMRWDQTFKHRR
jgi:hypothetical protein